MFQVVMLYSLFAAGLARGEPAASPSPVTSSPPIEYTPMVQLSVGFEVSVPVGWQQDRLKNGSFLLGPPESPSSRITVGIRVGPSPLDRAAYTDSVRQGLIDAQSQVGPLSERHGAGGPYTFFVGRLKTAYGMRDMFNSVHVAGGRAAFVAVSMPTGRADLKQIASHILKSFRLIPQRKTVAEVAPCQVSATTFRIRLPQGWSCKLDDTGLLSVRQGLTKLVMLRIQRLAGVEPYDQLVAKQLANLGPGAKNAVEGPRVKLAAQEIRTRTFETMSEGRLLRSTIGIAGKPGAYHDIGYAAEPDVYDAHLAEALAALATLVTAK